MRKLKESKSWNKQASMTGEQEGWGWVPEPPHDHYFVVVPCHIEGVGRGKMAVSLCGKERMQEPEPAYLYPMLLDHPVQCSQCRGAANERRRKE